MKTWHWIVLGLVAVAVYDYEKNYGAPSGWTHHVVKRPNGTIDVYVRDGDGAWYSIADIGSGENSQGSESAPIPAGDQLHPMPM